MNTIKTETKQEQAQLRDILDLHKVPYEFFDFGQSTNGKKDMRSIVGITKGWMEFSYSRTQTDNKKKPRYTKMNVNLRKSPFMVVDIDIKEEWKANWKEDKFILNEIYQVQEKIGDYYFRTLSTGSSSPHYWFFKHENDKNKNNVVKTKMFGDFKFIEVDLIYQNTFEKRVNEVDEGFYYSYDYGSEAETKCKFFHYQKIQKIQKKKKLTEKQQKQKVAFNSAVDVRQTFPEVDDETRAILDNIDIDLFDNFKTWHQFISACYNHFGDYLIAIEYSRRHSKFESAENVIQHVNQRSEATFGTICWLSIQSNKQRHYEIRKQFSESIDFSDSGLAKCFLEDNKGKFVSQFEETFILNEKTNFWRRDKFKSVLFTTAQDYLIKKMNLMKKKYANTLAGLERVAAVLDDDNVSKIKREIQNLEERLETVIKFAHKIGMYNDANSIVKQIKLQLNCNSFDEIPFDRVRPESICFKNQSFSLKIGEIGEKVLVNPDDYITQTTGYDWREPTDEEMKTINDIIEKIFVDVDIRNTYLSILFSGMIGKQFERFILANGDGRNGKGVIHELFAVMMGSEYYFNGDVKTLTGRNFGNGESASPNTVAMGLKRCIHFEEPEDSDVINGGIMKRISGSTVINARGMYKSTIHPIYLLGTCIIECNKKPKINARTDTSIYERIVDVPFESSFLSQEDVDKDKTGLVFLKDSRFKDEEFKRTHKFALFKYLIEWGKKNWTGNIYVAERCQEMSRNFINSNDEVRGWLDENYEITESKLDKITFKNIYDDFKNHIEYDRLSTSERKRWKRQAFKEVFDKSDYNIESSKHTSGNVLTYFYIKRIDVEE